MLLSESFSVDAACVIESEDEVHASDHADRNTVGELNEELGHSHALISHCRLASYGAVNERRAYELRAPKTPVICMARRASSACRYIEVVEIEECRRLSRTAVSSVPPSSAWVACVCLIQCGVARRSF